VLVGEANFDKSGPCLGPKLKIVFGDKI